MGDHNDFKDGEKVACWCHFDPRGGAELIQGRVYTIAQVIGVWVELVELPGLSFRADRFMYPEPRG